MRLDTHSLAACGAVAREKNRYAINGVYLAPDGTTVATDGRMLLSVEPLSNGNTRVKLPEIGAVLPANEVRDLAKAVKQARKSDDEAAAELVEYKRTKAKKGDDDDPGEVCFRVGANGSTLQREVELVPGKFPQYIGVLPQPNGKTVRVRLSLEVLKKFVTSLHQIAQDKDATVEFSVSSAEEPVLARCRFDQGRHALGLVMPVTGGDDWMPTDWERQHWGLKPSSGAKKEPTDQSRTPESEPTDSQSCEGAGPAGASSPKRKRTRKPKPPESEQADPQPNVEVERISAPASEVKPPRKPKSPDGKKKRKAKARPKTKTRTATLPQFL